METYIESINISPELNLRITNYITATKKRFRYILPRLFFFTFYEVNIDEQILICANINYLYTNFESFIVDKKKRDITKTSYIVNVMYNFEIYHSCLKWPVGLVRGLDYFIKQLIKFSLIHYNYSKYTRKIACALYSQNYLALYFLPNRLLSEEFVSELSNKNPEYKSSYQFCKTNDYHHHKQFLEVLKFWLECCTTNGLFIKRTYNPTIKIRLAAVKQNGMALVYIKQQNKNIIQAALRQNPNATIHVQTNLIDTLDYKYKKLFK